MLQQPTPVAARSKARVCGRQLARITGSNPTVGLNVCLSVVSVVCSLVEVSATNRSLVQRSPSSSSSSSSFYWASVANAPNVLQPYWLIVLPLDLPNLTASFLL